VSKKYSHWSFWYNFLAGKICLKFFYTYKIVPTKLHKIILRVINLTCCREGLCLYYPGGRKVINELIAVAKINLQREKYDIYN
jgi:hypothetical protein